MQRLEAKDVEPMTGDEESARPDLSPPPEQQVLDAACGGAVGDDQVVCDDAPKSMVDARAERFRQAVDDSIVLANDGVIRWLGEPIAKLARGSDLLAPRAVVLVDYRLPDRAHDIMAARLELWLAASVRRLLGPLIALQELKEGSRRVLDVASKIVGSLGILERDSIRSQIKALDQDSRAALRKHGVRFGAYYVYVPTILKPASRVLALQLWGLQASDSDGDALVPTLIPMAASGRTSLPHDKLIAREGYRSAGYRPCGEKVIRVDIVERLSDMIRTALGQHSTTSNLGSVGAEARGFAVDGKMTSLTGCSGVDFASILQSLDFESFEATRPTASAVATQTSGVEAEPQSALSADAPDGAEGQAHNIAREPVSNFRADMQWHREEGHEGDVPISPSEVCRDASGSVGAQDPPKLETATFWRPRRKRQSDPSRKAICAPQLRAEPPAQDRKGASDAEQASTEGKRSKGGYWKSTRSRSGYRQPPSVPHTKGLENAADKSKVTPNPSPTIAVDPDSPFAKLIELRSRLLAGSKDSS